MLEKEIKLKLLWKNSIGNNIKLFFGEKASEASHVLVLINVVAFRDNGFPSVSSFFLQVREGGSTYGFDVSLRLKKPEYEYYKEVFLFVDKQGHNIAFRALAEDAAWKEYSELTKEELNN